LNLSKFIKTSLAASVLILLWIVIFVSSTFRIIHSQTSTEIESEINEHKKNLEDTKNQISELEAQLAKNSENLKNAAEGIPKLEAEMKELETQIEINNKKLEQIQIEKDLKEKEQLKLINEQTESVNTTYKQWRVNSNTMNKMFTDNRDLSKSTYYTSKVFETGNDFISDLEGRISDLKEEISDTSAVSENLSKLNEELKQKKAEIEAQIQYYNSIYASNASSIDKLQNQQAAIENTINSLLVEQQEAAVKEREILNQNPNPNPNPPTQPPANLQNPFKFSGQGRDLYQGHGVGMSQWGAYGAGYAGMTYEQIIKFYYANVRIEARPQNIDVEGYGWIDSNIYAAGLGEVPSRACGNSEQVSARPDKYILDNPNTAWDCWPEEAIKAQVIVGRSYAIAYGSRICTSAACQVYEGGQAKKWAADETKDLVIVSNGGTSTNQVIQAVYSSDNSQGAGTADNDTIFQNFYGDGSPFSYLRAANDSAFAANGGYAYWTYQTGNYDLNYVYGMVQFTASNPASTATWTGKTGSQDLLNIGKFTEMSFERDPSGRVKKVWLKGESGQSKSMGGWWFKNLWNNYVYDIGTYDYIYSQTFYLNPV
jgi:peptidoglycan hydrolase-like amidase